MKYQNQKYVVTNIEIVDPEPETCIPPAGIHPVLAARGKHVKFLSDVQIKTGVIIQLDSGYGDGMPYNVEIINCEDNQNNTYLITGKIV